MHAIRPIVPRCLAALFVALLCCASAAFAQYNSYSAYTNIAPDSTALLLDSAKAVANSAPARSLQLVNRALQSAIVHRNANGEARAYLLLGKLQQQSGHIKEAIESWEKCKRTFGSANLAITNTSTYGNATYGNSTYGNAPKKNLASDQAVMREVVASLTRAYEDAQDYDAAFAESEVWLQMNAGRPAHDDILRTQARLRSHMGKRQDAVRRFRQLLAQEQAAGDHAGACATLIQLAAHHQRQGDLAEAKSLLEQARTLAEQQGLQEPKAEATRDLAEIYHAEGKLAEELQLRNSLLTQPGITPNVVTNSLQNIAIGNAYLQANQPELAEGYVETGVATITSTNNLCSSVTPNVFAGGTISSTVTFTSSSADLQVGANAYRFLAEGYLKKSELEKSLEYYKKYAELQDSVQATQDRELAAAMALSKDFGKNEERVQLLERERALADASIDLLREDQSVKSSQIFTRNLIIGVLVGCLILAIIGGIVLVRNTRARRRADKLLALQSMTGQMNPHFIFNALNSVNEYIAQNDERAANRYLSAFSKLMRKVMDDSKHTFIPLAEEIDMLKLYLELEHARFRDQFTYAFEVDAALAHSEFELPPMLVQPYVENAIWHGLRYRPAGGKLHIRFAQDADNLLITIADEGIGIAQSKAIKTTQQRRQQSMGMQNIGTRMALLNEIYGLAMSVQITETQPGAEYPGTTVRLVLPQQAAKAGAQHSPLPSPA